MENLLNNLLTSNGKTGKNAKWLCCFHSDSKPSLSINPKTGKAHCFPCSKDFDAIDIIQKVKGLDFKTAKEFLLSFNGNSTPICNSSKEIAKKTSNYIELSKEQKTLNIEVYGAFLKMLSLTQKGLEYLASRGLSKATADRWKIKSIDDPKPIYKELLAIFGIHRLKTAGLIHTKEFKNKQDQTYTIDFFIFSLSCVIFPVLVNNTPVYLTARNIAKDAPFKAVCLAGVSKPLFIGNPESKDLVLFEGIPDVLSYFELTGKDNFIACLGLPTPDRLQPLYIDGKRLISALDNDQAAFNAIERIKQAGYDLPVFNLSAYLETILKNYNCQGLDLTAKDLNDALKIRRSLENDKAVLNQLFISLSETTKEDFNERISIMIHDSNLTEQTAKIYALLRVCYGWKHYRKQ